jgi:hypothetical protein
MTALCASDVALTPFLICNLFLSQGTNVKIRIATASGEVKRSGGGSNTPTNRTGSLLKPPLFIEPDFGEETAQACANACLQECFG